MSRSECIFHESSAFARFEVADRERSVSAVGTEGRWERERDRLWDSEAVPSLDPADYS